MNDEPRQIVPVPAMSLEAAANPLVSRGLELLVGERPRIMHFPEDRAVGEVFASDREGGWDAPVAEAIGTVIVPANRFIGLFADAGPLDYLARLPCQVLSTLLLSDLPNVPGDRAMARLMSRMTHFFRHGLYESTLESERLGYVSDLQNLITLQVHAGNLPDEGLRDVAKLQTLRNLSMRGIWSEHALHHLVGLQELTTLILGEGTEVEGNGLHYLVALPGLRELDLRNNIMRDDGFRHLAYLTNLRKLQLGGHGVTDNNLSHIANLPRLRHLHVSAAKVMAAGIEHVGWLTSLEWLHLAFVVVEEGGLRALSRLRGLRELSLRGVIADEALTDLADLPNLRSLNLSYSSVTNDGLRHVARLARLEDLSLDGTRVMDQGLDYLADCTSLRTLRINSTRVTQGGRSKLQHRLPGLTIK